MGEAEKEIEKIERAAMQAADVVARSAADAKAVITTAAASAISTLTTAAAVQSRDIEYIRNDLSKINSKLDNMESKYVSLSVFDPVAQKLKELDEKTVRMADFVFWRNLLVSGMVLTIFLAILSKWI